MWAIQDKLALYRLENALFVAENCEGAVSVPLADLICSEPSLCIDLGFRQLRVPKVPHEDILTPDLDTSSLRHTWANKQTVWKLKNGRREIGGRTA